MPGERNALIGRTLGHYRIVDRLGSGGMGVVWLAEDLKLRRRVALKMLREDLASSADKATRFDREAKAIAALSHPNIVTIHAIEDIDGVRFLAMEYLEGQTLADLIPADGFPLPELLRLAVPVAEALAAAHARGITHRDLKPSNIIVTGDGRVKVLDFGLAKLQGGDVTQIYGREHETTLTQEGTVVGTLHYMSPEQLQLKHVDHRSDLYSLGVVLYEMATGDLPFRGESAAQVISSVLRDRPRRLDDVDSRMPPEIADLVASCLEKDLNKRLASAAEARDRLSAVAHALETGALSLASSRLRRLVGGPNRVRTRWLAAGVTALAVAVAAIPWAMRELRDSRTQSTEATGDASEARIPSIAVLPFANYSGDPDYFVDGMTDGVIGALGRLGGVRVISRQSAMHYKNSTKKLPEIAEELDVEYLVEGSVSRELNAVRLQARVVRPEPEQQVWAETYSQPASNVIALHEAIAIAIGRAVGGSRSASTSAGRSAARSIDPTVYEAYLQGRHFSQRFDAASQRQAESHYRRAIALDPSFAPAWVGLAESLHLLFQFHVTPASLEGQAEAAVRRAIELEPSSAEAFAALAQILRDRFAWSEAESAIERAIQLDPSSAAARRRHWMLLACRLRLDEALEEITLARRLDPLSAMISGDLAIQLAFMNRFEEAIKELKRTLELDPTYAPAHAYLYVAYSELGLDEESARELRSYLSGLGLSALVPDYEARLRRDGFTAARRWLALRLASDNDILDSRLGVVAGLLAQAGEDQEALRVLRIGWDRRAWELGWLAVAPDLRNLHGQPEFDLLLTELGLPRPRS